MIALIIFLGVVVYLKVPAMIAKSLDERAAKIRGELDEARRLREEAQQLLAEYQQEAQGSRAGSRPTSSRPPSARATARRRGAHKKTEEYVARRTALAEQKIGQAERDAVSEVRAIAVDIATEAARKLLAGKLDETTSAELFRDSLTAVQTKLN